MLTLYHVCQKRSHNCIKLMNQLTKEGKADVPNFVKHFVAERPHKLAKIWYGTIYKEL
jgi:hypothetical protein